AYRKALETLVALPPQSWHDDTYETTLRSVRDAFATTVLNARLHLLQEARNHVATERTQSHEKQVVTYLDYLSAKYARAEADINHVLESRISGAKISADLLPKSFWGTTTERSEAASLPRRN